MRQRPKRLRRYEYVERRDGVGEAAYNAVRLLEDVERRHEHATLHYASREELLVRIGGLLADVKRAREIVDRLCWRRIPARRRVIEDE